MTGVLRNPSTPIGEREERVMTEADSIVIHPQVKEWLRVAQVTTNKKKKEYSRDCKQCHHTPGFRMVGLPE